MRITACAVLERGISPLSLAITVRVWEVMSSGVGAWAKDNLPFPESMLKREEVVSREYVSSALLPESLSVATGCRRSLPGAAAMKHMSVV